MNELKELITRNIAPVENMIDEICTEENISESFDYVVTHLECIQQKEHIKPKKEYYCKSLKEQLSTGIFRITEKDFRTMVVTDGPKARTVQAPSVYHRVGCHAIMVVFEKYSHQTLIKNTAASIKGRGMHWLHNVVEEDLLADPDGMKYYYQCDIFHFYDTISQEIMKAQVREYTTDPVVLPMIDNFVTLLPEGLSKGLRSSQSLANLHLNDVDHAMCAEVGYHTTDAGTEMLIYGASALTIDGKEVRFHYYRYCDDIVMIAATKKELWRLRNILVEQLAKLGLKIKPNEAVRPLRDGLDYLGYVTYVDDSKPQRAVYSRIRKRTKQKFARRIKRVKSRKRRQALIGSFFGMAAHADCRNLLKSLITPIEFNKLKHKRKMKDFRDFNIKPTTFNGKKSFKGTNISGSELDRRCIVVVDYETDLTPTWESEAYNQRLQDASLKGIDPNLVQKPKSKTLISIIHEGKMRKLWTGDNEIKQILQQVPENDFPFFVAVEIDYSGRYKKMNLVPVEKFNLTPPSEEEVKRILALYNIKLNK